MGVNIFDMMTITVAMHVHVSELIDSQVRYRDLSLFTLVALVTQAHLYFTCLQAVEFSKLVSSLRPDESEDVVLSACQKLTVFFHQRPEQKFVFVTQHGMLPLMELLEVPRTRVCLATSQLIIFN